MRTITAVAALLLGTTAAIAAAPAVSPAISRALTNPARADQAADDARRDAAAVLAFSGVKPGWSVVDYIPASGYWTRIFTGIVGPAGHVYGIWPQAMGGHGADGAAKLTARGLTNVTAEVQATDLPTVPAPVDLFWTVQNYHDIANIDGEAGMAAFNKAVFAALKPGGTYLVIDHAAAAGSGLRDAKTLHRIDPAAAKAEIVKAGFTFEGELPALRNPADDHSKKVFDPAIRGHTDQFAYKFVKPR